MGLSLHWELVLAGVDADRAREVVRSLHVAAEAAGFSEVSPVIEAFAARATVAGGDRGEVLGESAGDAVADRAWALSQTLVTAEPVPAALARGVGGGGFGPSLDGGQPHRIVADHAVVFRGYTGGAEDAAFGLAAYPGEEAIFRFASGCSTHGAYGRGGPTALLNAHRAVVRVLDKARSLGVRVTVKDDGEYWTRRDPKVLLDKYEEWEALRRALSCGAAKRGEARIAPLLRSASGKRLDRPVSEELEG